MRRIYSLLLSALLLFAMGGLSAHAADCPSGTTKKSEVTKEGLRVESCQDGAGKKQGIQTAWYESGKKMSVTEFLDGKRHGPCTIWHENGKKSMACEFHKDEQHGTWIYWDKKGNKTAENRFKKGTKHGTWNIWHPNGTKATTGKYQDGKKHGKWTFAAKNGKVVMVETCDMGKCKQKLSF